MFVVYLWIVGLLVYIIIYFKFILILLNSLLCPAFISL